MSDGRKSAAVANQAKAPRMTSVSFATIGRCRASDQMVVVRSLACEPSDRKGVAVAAVTDSRSIRELDDVLLDLAGALEAASLVVRKRHGRIERTRVKPDDVRSKRPGFLDCPGQHRAAEALSNEFRR